MNTKLSPEIRKAVQDVLARAGKNDPSDDDYLDAARLAFEEDPGLIPLTTADKLLEKIALFKN